MLSTSTQMAPDEIKGKMRVLLQRVPGAVGADGHLGGRLSSSRPHMGAVLEALSNAGLFFLDRRPADTSIATPLARQMGMRIAVRTHRIEADEQTIAAKLRAVEVALVLEGHALVVAAPHPELLRALGPWIQGLRKRKIHVMRLSEIVL